MYNIEQQPNNQFNVITAKPSAVILIARLLLLETGFLVLYSLIKIPQIVFSGQLDGWLQSTNFISWLVIVISSLGQMAAVTLTVLAWANEYYLVRNDSIIHHFGIFKTVEEEYSLRNIEALTLEQNIWQKIFNFGTIHFFSPVLKQEYYLTNISQPKIVRDLIDQAVGASKIGKNEKIIFRR